MTSFPQEAMDELKLGIFNLLNWRLESGLARKLSFPLLFSIAEQARDVTSNSTHASYILSFSYNQAAAAHEKREYEEVQKLVKYHFILM